MNIEPLDFLIAKSSVDYFNAVFNLDIDDEMHSYHIYNRAMVNSTMTSMPKEINEVMANKDDFLENMRMFADRYWELTNDAYEILK